MNKNKVNILKIRKATLYNHMIPRYYNFRYKYYNNINNTI